MRFRPCIDLHGGQVKQIVGSTLSDDPARPPRTNFVADQPPAHFAALYRRDGLAGGHVILLGPGNAAAATAALAAWPGGLQLGGGVTPANARQWLERGAAKVIVTSWLFPEGEFAEPRLRELAALVGPERLVVDLSCRRTATGYTVASQRWQALTSLRLTAAALARLAASCGEFLVHAVDVEGKQAGIDEELVRLLGADCPVPVTYAGGIRHLADLDRIEELGRGRVDATAGSSLDIFGGQGLRYAEVVAWDRRRR
ncbi:MAG: phosphoribosylformimino-5-aminoimidazole carboxamide ribotide isomerase [Lentisphaeria bacterium]|jgi:phosphoribosylformimino-5-aminoimidazole carboxamide ribotide isomerase